MKFRCERDTLGEALSTAGRSVATRGGSGAGAFGLRVQVSANKLMVIGTDLDLTMRVELEVVGLDDGAFVAPARLITDIVRSLEPGGVTFGGGQDEVEISGSWCVPTRWTIFQYWLILVLNRFACLRQCLLRHCAKWCARPPMTIRDHF